MKNQPSKDISKISIETDGDIIFTTVGKYKLFYSYGKIGMDAYLLYSHLQFTARLQGTNSVEAKNKYLRQGLSWGKDKLQNAKNLLNELGLICNVTRRREDGTIAGHYVEIKTTTKVELEPSRDPSIHLMDQPEGGFREPNALTNNLNALTNNINCNINSNKPNFTVEKKDKILEIWLSFKKDYPLCIKSHRNSSIIKTKHTKICEADLKEAITNYCEVVTSDLYWYNKPYVKGLVSFLENIDQWIDIDRSQYLSTAKKTEVQSDLDRMMSSATNN